MTATVDSPEDKVIVRKRARPSKQRQIDQLATWQSRARMVLAELSRRRKSIATQDRLLRTALDSSGCVHSGWLDSEYWRRVQLAAIGSEV